MITLSLQQFLNFAFYSHNPPLEYVLVEPRVAIQFIQLNGAADIIHIEQDCVPANDNIVYSRIWLRKAWVESQAKYKKDKIDGDKRRLFYDLKHEATFALIKAIRKMSGIDEEIARTMAQGILFKKNINAAKAFGVDLTSEKYKLLIEYKNWFEI